MHQDGCNGGIKVQDFRDFAVEGMLKNGRQVLIRAIRPDDKEAMLNGFANLSGHSRQLRFFGFKNEISARELQYYTEVDDIHHVALVVIVKDNGDERIIGGGRYLEYDTPDQQGHAELAFAIANES
jgi:hypothetical protein